MGAQASIYYNMASPLVLDTLIFKTHDLGREWRNHSNNDGEEEVKYNFNPKYKTTSFCVER